MGAAEVTIGSEDPNSEECLLLLENLTAELSALYDDDGGGNSFKPSDASGERAIFLVARIAGEPVGCGAIRSFERNTAELKRLYVVPHARAFGIGRRLLVELETAAGNLGYTRVRLETGLKQPEAIGLYESSGYDRVPCHGEYANNPLSVCFEKDLG